MEYTFDSELTHSTQRMAGDEYRSPAQELHELVRMARLVWMARHLDRGLRILSARIFYSGPLGLPGLQSPLVQLGNSALDLVNPIPEQVEFDP